MARPHLQVNARLSFRYEPIKTGIL